MENENNFEGFCIRKQWTIGGKIGKGGYATLYSAVDRYSGKQVAVKIEDTTRIRGRPPLKGEYEIMKQLNSPSSFPGIPNIFTFENVASHNMLVLERLGLNLHDVYMKHNRFFSNRTIIRIGLQLVRLIRYIHGRGFVHGDIHLKNILLGPHANDKNQLYLVDFGKSKPAHRDRNGFLVDIVDAMNVLFWLFNGNEDCMTEDVIEPYVLDSTWRHQVQGNLHNLCAERSRYGGLPEEITTAVNEISRMHCEDTPNYSTLINLFEGFLSRHRNSSSRHFDWTN